jgi:hypothetical protein
MRSFFTKKNSEEGDGYPERFVSSLISNFKMRESKCMIVFSHECLVKCQTRKKKKKIDNDRMAPVAI